MPNISLTKQLLRNSRSFGQRLLKRNRRNSNMCNSVSSRSDRDGSFSTLEASEVSQPEEPLLDRLGGMIVLSSIANEFCRRVTEDTTLNVFFEGVDPRVLTSHQKFFFVMAFTGVKKEVDEVLAVRAGHQRLLAMGLCEAHFDIFARHLLETLIDRGFRSSIVDEARASLVPIRVIFKEAAEGCH